MDNIYEFIDDQKAKQIEIETEINFCYPNQEIISVFKLAQSLNKHVLITSDMYLPQVVILKMLHKAGIVGNFTLNISNVNHLSKYQGEIYKYYIEKFSKRKILHIGDDEFSDIYQAKLFGITSFLIPQTAKHLSSFIKTIHDKIAYGIILIKCKDNFSNKLKCLSMEDFGYFIAPLIFNYMNWLYREVRNKKVDKILFISRDGYLLEKLYRLYPDPKPSGIYFYTSRRALGVCSIKSEKDIIDTFNVYYLSRRISIKQFINAAFGVEIDDEYSNKYMNDINKDDLLKYILSLKTEIFANANNEYKEYREYINSVCDENEVLAVINFVGSGSTQFFAEKLFKNRLLFLYFQTTSDIKKNKLNFNNLFSCYGNFLSPFTSNNMLTLHYHDLEAILTSPEEQFVKFQDNKKVFCASINDNFQNIEPSHESILSFFNEIIQLNKNWWDIDYSLNFIDNLLSCPFKNINITLNENIKKYLTITDSFAQVPTKQE